MKPLRIGMAQLLVEGGEPERNFERAVEMVASASLQGCQVVLFPECMDLAWTHPSAKIEAQPIPGLFSDRLCELAKVHGVYICAGLTERDGDRLYNAAVLINDSGSIILKYRKINVLTKAQEYYSIGQSLGVVETPFGIIGVNICSDNYIDSIEIGHTLARMGAKIILSPSSWTVEYSVTEETDPYAEKWIKPYHTLAMLHDLVVVSVTSVGYIVGGPFEGRKMLGGSMMVNKDGLVTQSHMNEFASILVVQEFYVPAKSPLGTNIGEELMAAGFYG